MQHLIDAGDLVAHDFFGRVPNTQAFAQFRVKSGQKGLVEILDGARGLESFEKRRLIDAVERVGGPVQHLGQVQRLELGGLRELAEQGGNHRHVQAVGGALPVERH